MEELTPQQEDYVLELAREKHFEEGTIECTLQRLVAEQLETGESDEEFWGKVQLACVDDLKNEVRFKYGD